jgi:RNA polymerase sigma-70 factor, ECF subfamily
MRAAPEPFDEVLGPLIGHGYALAFTMLNDRPAAEDAVQEASIKAWRKLPGLRDRAALLPWFLAIVANECRSVRRGRWWSVLKSPDIAPAWSGGEPRSAEGLDLERAIDRLGPEDRLPLLLHFYLDLTFEQVGIALGLSMTAARSRVYRSLDRLRVSLDLTGTVANG